MISACYKGVLPTDLYRYCLQIYIIKPTDLYPIDSYVDTLSRIF